MKEVQKVEMLHDWVGFCMESHHEFPQNQSAQKSLSSWPKEKWEDAPPGPASLLLNAPIVLRIMADRIFLKIG